MNILEFFLLPVIILLGIITSYEDIKFGKIRNKWVVSALIYGFVVYTLLISWYYFIGLINWNYVTEIFTNLFFALVVGFGLWHFKIWTAADGKLFIAFALLIPFSAYASGYQKYIPSINLLINIFILGFLFVFFLIIYKSNSKEIKKTFSSFLKEFLNIREFAKSIFYLFILSWIIQISFSLIQINSHIILSFLAVLIFFLLKTKIKNKYFYLLIPVVLLRFFLDKSIYSFLFLKNFLIIIFVWRFIVGFGIRFLSYLGINLFSKEIKINNIKPGMIISKPRDNKKISIKLNNSIDCGPEGLTKEQIKLIRKMGIKKIRIEQTIPFAPTIFLGVILTLLLKGKILIVLNHFF